MISAKSQEMALSALRTKLGNAYDNLYRAKLQLRANPEWRSGNDESIQDMVADYQKYHDEIEAAIAELEGK
jgi:hypothetical protein